MSDMNDREQYPGTPGPVQGGGVNDAGTPPRPPLPPTPPQPSEEPQSSAFGWAAAPAASAEPAAPTAETTAPEGKVGAGKIVAVLVAAALVGAGSGLGGAAIGAAMFDGDGTVVSSGPSQVIINDTDEVNQTAAIAAKTLPSVVTISASDGSSGGSGSGVILSEDGYVVTNTHVVTLDGATAEPALRATTSDGRVFDATIVGTDPIYDLAVIKLTDAEDLDPIEFADSSDLNVGDTTVAVGAPLGLSNTVTTGIVSALNRSIQIASAAAPDSGDQEEGEDSPFQFDFGQGQGQTGSTGTISIAVIQTDAAINPGNSGGALVDGQGDLIGINVAIATAGGSSSEGAGSIGVGFAIPSNIVERVTQELIEDGVATHGLLGAMVGNAAQVDDATLAGAYIDEVTPGGAAAEAGLRAGDIVTGFDGVPITDATDLTAQVRALPGGAEADLTYVRDGEAREVTVTLGDLQS